MKTKTAVFSTSKPVTLHIPTGKIDVQKSMRAFLANLVHSLDGSNIHLLIELIAEHQDIYPIYTIHDCFATTANNIIYMEELIKEAFIHIYFSDQEYLRFIHFTILRELQRKYVITDEIVFIDYEEVVVINNKQFVIPKLPYPAVNKDEINKTFPGTF